MPSLYISARAVQGRPRTSRRKRVGRSGWAAGCYDRGGQGSSERGGHGGHRGGAGGAGGATAAFRVRKLPAGAGGRGLGHPWRPRYAGGHAHGRGQVDLLSGARHRAGRPHARGEPARVAHGRSGARAHRRGRARGVSELHAHARPAGHRAAPCGARGLSDHVRGARAPFRSALPRVRPSRARPARGRGRGALRVAVGAGLPSVVPRHRRLHRAAAHASGRRGAHRHGHRARAARHRAPSGFARPLRGGDRVRPPEPLLRRGALGAEAQAGPHRLLRAGTRRGKRHRLLLHAQGCGEAARSAGGGRRARDALPRGAFHGRAAGEPARVHRRRRAGDGGHERVRHGHRQVERALCHPPQHARLHRGVLPGGGPRRARWRAERVLAVLERRRRVHLPLLHRTGAGQRGAFTCGGRCRACLASPPLRGDVRLLPDDGLPAQVHPGVFRGARAGGGGGRGSRRGKRRERRVRLGGEGRRNLLL